MPDAEDDINIPQKGYPMKALILLFQCGSLMNGYGNGQ